MQKQIDGLTGLRNKQCFLEEVLKLEKSRFTLALVDLDNFKPANDKFGHAVGDAIICDLGHHLKDEIGNHGQVFRYGGEEFGIILPDAEKETGLFIMENIRRSFETDHQYEVNGEKVIIPMRFSCGVAASPDDADNAQDLLRFCDEALYRAKMSGRNKCCLSKIEKMIPKTVHYTKIQLERLSKLAEQSGINEAALLREALDDLLKKHIF
ncbi:MAG: GGDEF domain-containing protein [Candidatus Wallbacteria bacterium HGW-Wallbacteria-1]|jgi:diguanylate cyclase (GGDEF)-like protein|uniref:GGDEF domain-containing protein n=1 Tax=Candidatus Wallbacteria bacterium HGW-Wallbacteria-1 TaxID=2013854 RepID=A0A2N1PKR0_9BACT|nr:MAG: GGDEF domain-containing protein [Candidatus Wallbacteria bacterium HGW-Wallbacteria-1]